MDKATYACMPATLAVREVRVRVTEPGFRIQVLVVVTTLLDARAYGAQDLAELYRVRWHAEINHSDCRSSDSLYPGTGAA